MPFKEIKLEIGGSNFQSFRDNFMGVIRTLRYIW